MKRKITVRTLCAVLFAVCSSAQAQPTGKVARIGFLDNSTASGVAVLLDAFRQELSKLGWIEGKNITIEYRFAEQKPERVLELAAELVRLKVDLIVVTAGAAVFAAKESNYDHPYRDDEHYGPRRRRSGCQFGAAGRQHHWAFRFSKRAKHQKARGTQGRRPQDSHELGFWGRRGVSNGKRLGLRLWH